jgi:NTP pyrophosphatase (non-canonical NTP hydrolase)
MTELMQFQRKFDERHAGALPFYSKITSENLGDLEHLVVCLLGELGEFANILKKVRRGDFELKSVKPEMDEELVDVFIYLLKIAVQFDVDLESGYVEKMRKNAERFSGFER